MPTFFLVIRFNINKSTGAESHSIQRYDDRVAALKRYYTLLATDIDNDNYIYELVQVMESDGTVFTSQVFENPVLE